MTAASRVRVLVGSAIWLVGTLVISWQQMAVAVQPAPADDPRFTGTSIVLESKDLGISRRRFEPSARSAWHSHDKGQLLFVEDGRARTQKRGQIMKELGLGESDYTGPNMVHWHGAVPHTHFIQVAVGFGGETKWMEKVTDDEYAGRK